MQFITVLAGLGFFIASATAHMQLYYPAPFNASNNPHRTTETADPYLEFPYDKAGESARWVYPCRGYETLLGTTDGAPTTTWTAGSTVNFTLWGPSALGGNHYGGSCQVGFSSDNGTTFRVATSYEGDCPHRNNGVGPEGQSFNLTVPVDLEPGVQLFAWTWYNREQEFNMNCAAVEILAPTSSSAVASDMVSMAFAKRPQMFVADDGNDCATPHTTAELKYPSPGPDIVEGDGEYPVKMPSGKCGQKEMLEEQAYGG